MQLGMLVHQGAHRVFTHADLDDQRGCRFAQHARLGSSGRNKQKERKSALREIDREGVTAHR